MARKFGIDREAFSEFLHAEKQALGKDPSDNFTWEELIELAELFKAGGQ